MELLLALPRLLLRCAAPDACISARGARRVHTPCQPHQTLSLDAKITRTIIVGDVHGCLDELKELLAACDYDADNTRVVLVGDLVNKGPFSAETVHFVRTSGFHCVRGNHDDAALFNYERRQAALKTGSPSPPDDKYAYCDKLTIEDVRFLRALPHTLALEDEKVIVVHAGLVPGLALWRQPAAGMVTMRNVCRRGTVEDETTAGALPEPDDYASPSWRWTASGAAGSPWASHWRPTCETGPQHVVFGHDAKRGIQFERHATGLDSGACYGKRLSALVLPEGRIVSVDSRRTYVKPGD